MRGVNFPTKTSLFFLLVIVGSVICHPIESEDVISTNNEEETDNGEENTTQDIVISENISIFEFLPIEHSIFHVK